MADQRNDSRKRRAFRTWLALTVVGTSFVLPNLYGDPPHSTEPKVQIRFTNPQTQAADKNVTDKSKAATSGSQTPAARPKDGKLAADIARVHDEPRKIQVVKDEQTSGSNPINVASEEERNQKIATDWEKPSVVFFITGKQSGYMEPCGCTGLENQKGGLNRRDSLLTALRARGWDIIPIDGGDQVRRSGRQAEIKYGWTASALQMLGYQATTFGEHDLDLGIDTLLHPMIDANAGKSELFVSANVSVMPDYDVPYKTIQVNKKKIGITAVLGEESSKKIQSKDVVVTPPIEALKKIMPKLRAEKCDYLVLLAHASLEETQAIAQAVPEFSLIVTAGGYGEPTYRPEPIPGTPSQVVQVGTKGMYVGLFGLFDDPSQPFRYQRVALSSQFEDSPRVMDLFGKYQDELKTVAFEGLGLRPQLHASTREFVGSEKCGECHTTAFSIWKDTPHAHATDSIVEPPQRSMARHFDPECLSCHVTGWNPQGFFPYYSGYESLASTPHMVANGCENCHGPGNKHVAAELGEMEADKAMMESLRSEMRLSMENARDKCIECHDLDNSPDFHKDGAFEKYWEQVKHVGKD